MRKDSDNTGRYLAARYGAELSTWSASSEGSNLPLPYPADAQKPRLIYEHIGLLWMYFPDKKGNFALSTHICEISSNNRRTSEIYSSD